MRYHNHQYRDTISRIAANQGIIIIIIIILFIYLFIYFWKKFKNLNQIYVSAVVVVSFIYDLTIEIYLLIQDVFPADHILIRQQALHKK